MIVLRKMSISVVCIFFSFFLLNERKNSKHLEIKGPKIGITVGSDFHNFGPSLRILLDFISKIKSVYCLKKKN